MQINIRNFAQNDWPSVREIYRQGIETRNATFETRVPEWNEWDKKHHKFCRLVAEEDNEVMGWAAILPVSGREVYKGVSEVSIYVSPSYSGKGIGRKLLDELIVQSEKNGIWTLQASIFPDNTGSRALFRSCGFREVGFREKIGKMNNIWRDTILFERRMK